MNGRDKYDVIALCIFAVSMIAVLFFLVTARQKEECKVSVPHDYQVIYDDNGKMLILPSEYHFECDENGKLTIVK